MLKWGKLLGLGLAGGTATGYYQYEHNHSFRSVCNLVVAGSRMACVYKNSTSSIQDKHTQASEYLKSALRSNGGIYLKLGQLIATLDVIVPDEYRTVMNTLTRECKSSSFETIKTTIEEDLGYPLDVVFKEFEHKPISSASIAQVHRAVLLNGEEVAVKVQHRELASQVESDLEMMHVFVKVAKFMFDEFHYQWLVDGFEKNIRKELDFMIEASNMKRTSYFLKQNKFHQIYVPQLKLAPTKRVLAMEFIHGTHLDELDRLRELKIDTKRIGMLFAQMIIKMIHKDGFVHADPHSGNLMARKHKGKDQLVVLDHGIYQELDKKMLRNYNQFWLGLILNDPTHYEKAGRELGTTDPAMLRSILTSKPSSEFSSSQRCAFDLNPSKDRQAIMDHAAKHHEQIIKVLEELSREMLLLLKVNQFARTIENMLAGREMGVYEDIAKECVMNLGFPWYTRMWYYFKMWRMQQ